MANTTRSPSREMSRLRPFPGVPASDAMIESCDGGIDGGAAGRWNHPIVPSAAPTAATPHGTHAMRRRSATTRGA
ncbi:MAG: hypothetical protein DMD35_14650 [Gemmatimonadetes bacterium]|nr:MAG: hypothetical protein DMD35_14650 [Gemmatimonadota bacterium]